MLTLRFARKGRYAVKTEWISEDPSLRHLDLSFVGESIIELQSVARCYISIDATTKDN